MSNAVTTLPTFGGPKTYSAPIENELGAGIEGSYGVMKYRGKTWRTVYKKVETELMRKDGDGARNSIDVVIVKSAKVKSKKYYVGGFTEGSGKRPDCKSGNGVTPDADSPTKQHTICATCPRNQWGSAPPRPDGSPSKGKACSDAKRIAIVPADPDADNADILRNDLLGGPMLLNVPATSLNALQAYGDKMAKCGYNAWAVITRISFDPSEAYPKFVFKEVRPLTVAEQAVADELHGGTQADRIVAEGEEDVHEEVQFAAALPPPVVVQPPKLAVVPPTPIVTQQVTTPPVAETGLPQSFEAQLDALLK